MGIINIKEKWSGNTAGGTNRRTATRVLSVLCDGPMDALEVARTPGIPRYGEAHPLDGWLRAGFPQVRTVAPWYFEVTVNYEIPGTSEFEDNPLNAPPDRRWSYVERSQEIDVDLDGKPIVNTAGEAFQGLTETVYDPLYTVSRNEKVAGAAISLIYNDAVNADPFLGAPPGTAWMRVEAEEVYTKYLVYCRMTYSVQFRVNERDHAGWKLRILNQGYNARPSIGAEPVPVFDRTTNAPMTTPSFLDENGMYIKPSALKAGKKAVWLMFRRKRAVPFGPLHLA